MKATISALALFGLLAFCAGCGGEGDASTTTTADTPQVDANMLARAKGKQVFKQTCVACHGEDAKGIEGLGKDWTKSEYIANSSDDEIVAFLKVGRTIEDPVNTTGIAMPPRGGNPNLTDEDLRNVVLYMRKLLEG
jgi:cytochrome c5